VKRVIWVVLSVVLVFSLILVGCSTSSAPPASSAPEGKSAPPVGNAPASIKIGAMLSLTGPDAATGVPSQFAFQYAIDEINKNGGVMVKAFNKKIPLVLDVKDNQTDPEKTMAAAEQLNADGCAVVVGTTLSGIAANIYEKNKLALVVNQCDIVGLTKQGFKYYFSTSKMNNGTADAVYQLVATLPKDQVPTKWAFFEEQADWIVELIQVMKQGGTKLGINYVYEGQYQMLAPDFSQLILGAKNAGAEVLVGAPTPPDAINMLKQMQQLNYHPKSIIFFRAPSDPSWADLGPLGNYVIESSQWDVNLSPKDPAVQAIVNAWTTKSGKNAVVQGLAPAYALIQIVASAIEKAGSLDRSAIKDAIAATDMDTMEGRMKFDAGGARVNPPLVVQQWQNGVQNMVWPNGANYNTKPVIWPIPNK
jgi:branched-chain amino acid transport system substrate-binding protein